MPWFILPFERDCRSNLWPGKGSPIWRVKSLPHTGSTVHRLLQRAIKAPSQASLFPFKAVRVLSCMISVQSQGVVSTWPGKIPFAPGYQEQYYIYLVSSVNANLMSNFININCIHCIVCESCVHSKQDRQCIKGSFNFF